MPVNAHWYHRNAARPYPLDDTATGADAAGGVLPPDLLADLVLRWPDRLGRFAFLSAAAVTPRLATLVVQACPAADSADDAVAIAALSVPLPADPGVAVAFEPLSPGVRGWAVFAEGVNRLRYSGRFAGPSAGLLSQRAARAYSEPGLLAVRGEHAGRWLTGRVRLRATPPMTVAAETRVVDGRTVDAVVFRLEDSPGGAFPVPAAAAEQVVGQAKTVFQEFYGPCGARPESLTCGNPQPVQTIGGVGPDCDGTLTIEFEGCAEPYPLEGGACGAVLQCDVGLSAFCPTPSLPDDDGLLPSEQLEISVGETPVSDGDGGEAPEPYAELDPASLPYVLCPSTDGLRDDARVESGEWGLENALADGGYNPCDGGETFAAASPGNQNLLVAAPLTGSYGRAVLTQFRVKQGPAGARHNAMVVLNFKSEPFRPTAFSYFAFVADYDRLSLRLVRFAGGRFTDLAEVEVRTLRLDRWFSLAVTAEPGDSDAEAKLTARVTSLTDPDTDTQLGPVTVGESSRYAPGDGRIGIGTDRSITQFTHVEVGVY